MTKICVNGGGFAGLSTALLLAADGHDVTVVERDAPPPSRDPEAVWEAWERRGVPQFRQTHVLLDRACGVLRRELPHVWARLLESGAMPHDMTAHPPLAASPEPLPAQPDDVMALLTRRSTAEAALRHAAEDDPRVDVRSGVAGKGLLTRGMGSGLYGLATSAGPIEADIVVDCAGRRSPMPEWVEDAGARRPFEHEADYRIQYWTQWFRLQPGAAMPVLRGRPARDVGPLEVLTCPADNGWFSITVVATAGDRRFRVLSDLEVLLRMLRRIPEVAEWVDESVSEPVGTILPMVSVVDKRRRYVIDGMACLPGLVGVGDSVGASNPSLARGTSFATMHALLLRDVLRADADAASLTERFEASLDEHFEPWWQATIETDTAHLARMEAVADGREPDVDQGWIFAHAGQHDAEVWRSLVRIGGVRDLPPVVMATTPGLLERVGETIARVGPPRVPELDVEAVLAP